MYAETARMTASASSVQAHHQLERVLDRHIRLNRVNECNLYLGCIDIFDKVFVIRQEGRENRKTPRL